MALPSGRRAIVERFPAITVSRLRDAVVASGHRVGDRLPVELPDGRFVVLELVYKPTNLGGRQMFARCPSCSRLVRVLRIVPEEPGMACIADLRRWYGAKYESQINN